MPALFAYLIAVGLLVGGGYGALSWLAAPEPVKVVAKAKPKPPPAHYADDAGSTPAQARPSNDGASEASKPGLAGKSEVNGADQAKVASTDKAVSSGQPLSASAKPEPPAGANARNANAQASGPAADQQARSVHAGIPQAASGQEAGQKADDAPPAEARQGDAVPAREEKQSAVAAVAPATAAKTARRPNVRQASRRSEKRRLDVMTLRTIELPDGRRMTQLIPYRAGDLPRRAGERGWDDRPAMAFEPDE